MVTNIVLQEELSQTLSIRENMSESADQEYQ
jgi:hypothetical protein